MQQLNLPLHFVFFKLTFLPPVIATFCSFRWQNLAYVLIGRPVGWQKRLIQDWETMTTPQETICTPLLWLQRPKVKPLSIRHYWTHKIINYLNSFPQTGQTVLFFPPQMSNSAWEAGSGNWRDMLTVWFWHMGIRAGPAKLSGWGKIYCCWTKALETGSSLRIQRSGDSSAYTDIKGSGEHEKHRGSLSATCPR